MLKLGNLLSKIKKKPAVEAAPELKEPLRFSTNWLIIFGVIFASVGTYLLIRTFAEAPATPAPGSYRETNFSSDPGWDGFANRLDSSIACKPINNDFGYSPSSFAGGSTGEIGGTVVRSTQYRSYYGKPVATKTLADRLSASGIINIPEVTGGSVYFGWFNSDTSREFRPSDSLMIRIDSRTGSFTAEATYGTKNYQIGGEGRISGLAYNTRHSWTIDYYPNDGSGKLVASVDGQALASTSLTDAQRADGASFNRFGILNQQIEGANLKIYLDNLTLDGQSFAFDSDPGWDGLNNHLNASDCFIHGRQDFGYSATNNAGGSTGEIGGLIWRSSKRDASGQEVGNPAWYADKVGPLSLDTPLYAKGKIRLTQASVDADANIGWFNSSDAAAAAQKKSGSRESNVFLLNLGGPSRSGPRLYPFYNTGGANSNRYDYDDPKTPLLNPHGSARNFSICYLPDVDKGDGKITLKIDADSVTGIPATEISLKVPKKDREAGAKFDRFGFHSVTSGGHSTQVFLDDLRYTAGPGDVPPPDDCGSPTVSTTPKPKPDPTPKPTPTPAPTPTPNPDRPRLAHPDGTLIFNANRSGVEIIKNGKASPIISAAIVISNGFSWNNIKDRTAGDDQLAAGPAQSFREGTLLESQGHVYVTDTTSSGVAQKRGVANWNSFVALGFSINEMLHVSPEILPAQDGSDLTSSSSHPDGTLIYNPNHNGVVLIENGQRRNIVYGEIFNSYGYHWDQIKNPTPGDNNLPQGSDLNTFREGTLLSAEGHIYVTSITSEGVQQKRGVTSWAAFVALGLNEKDAIKVPTYQLPSQDGPALSL